MQKYSIAAVNLQSNQVKDTISLMAFLVPFLIAIAIIALTVYAVQKWMKYRAFCQIIDKIPGPPAIPLFGNTHAIKLDRVGFAEQMKEWYSSYGKDEVFRLWLGPTPQIMLCTAEAAEPVLTSNKLIQKSPNYNKLMTWLGTGLLTSTGDKWRSRRKMLTPTFHFSILNSFVDVFNEQSNVLVEQLTEASKSGGSFDIFPYVGRCALDIICETAMGVKIHAQINHNSKYVHAVQKMSETIMHYERKPWLWIKPIFYALGYGGEFDRCLNILKDFSNKVILDRSQLLKQETQTGTVRSTRQAFLDLLLLMQDENKLTIEDIREEVDTFMFEGHDTTAAGMSWAIYLLGLHPEVQQKVTEELETIFDGSSRVPTADDLKQMKYLECVIKESLRLYPPVPWFGRNCTEDFVAGRFTIPKGCYVNVVPYFIHRNQAVFGEDAAEFRPERFETDETNGRSPYAFVPFSAGPRNCIGQKFALMEEKVVLSTVVRNFKIESVEPRKNVHEVHDLILRPFDGIHVRLTLRK